MPNSPEDAYTNLLGNILSFSEVRHLGTSGDIDLRGTAITSLPDNIGVDGDTYKDF